MDKKKKRNPLAEPKQPALLYHDRVVIVTGAGRGIGRSLAILYARRGAKVIVNDIGCTLDGIGKDPEKADNVVNKIRAFGGTAIANYDSVTNSDAIVKYAIENFGKIDVLVCNAGITVPKPLEESTEDEWNKAMEVHFYANYNLILRCWPLFQKQKYGRVVIAVGEALKSKPNHAIYASTKMALLGLCQSLSAEGSEFGIYCNAYAPVAYTRMSRRDYVDHHESIQHVLHPKKVAPLIGYLTHENCQENGSLFKVGLSLFYKMEYRDAIKFNIPRQFKSVKQDPKFEGKIAVVTGAKVGLGKFIALQLSKLGASVLAFSECQEGKLKRIDPITSKDIDEHGLPPMKAIDNVIKEFGYVDVLVNCPAPIKAGLKSSCNHYLSLTYSVTRALWSHFIERKCGNIVNIAPMNKAAAETIEMGMVGLTTALATEGLQYDIRINTLVGTFDEKGRETQSAVLIACLLSAPNTPYHGALLEVNEGKVFYVLPSRSQGLDLSTFNISTYSYPEEIHKNWEKLVRFNNKPIIEAGLIDLIAGPQIISQPSNKRYSVSNISKKSSHEKRYSYSQASYTESLYNV